MGIFSRISNSISTIRDIERKIEAHKEIVKKTTREKVGNWNL